MTAIVLDCETTGVVDPEVIQLAHTAPMAEPNALYEPGFDWTQRRYKPKGTISLGAMATHHIIPEDLLDCEPWPGRWDPPEGVTYIIGHKIDFDWGAIGSPHVARIDTLSLSRALLPDLDSHKLGALVYYFALRDVAREKLKNAHDAVVDIDNCRFVLIEMLKSLPAISTWHDLWVLSEKARVPTRLSFGKYGPQSEWAKMAKQPGILISELRRRDPDYVRWLLSGKCDQVNSDPYLAKALRGEAA